MSEKSNRLCELQIRSVVQTCFFSLVVFFGLVAAAVVPADTTATAVDDDTSGRLESQEPAEEPPTAVPDAGDRDV